MSQIFLGTASFIYMLVKHKKNFYFPSEFSLAIDIPKMGTHTLYITTFNNRPDDCGFIEANITFLKELFVNDLNIILNFCERKYDKPRNNLSHFHCPVSEDPDSRNKIPTKVKVAGEYKEFNCLFNCNTDPKGLNTRML